MVTVDKIILMANYGYRGYIHNILKFFERVGIPLEKVRLYALDDDTKGEFEGSIEVVESKGFSNSLAIFGSKEFHKLVSHKLTVVTNELEEGNTILFVDGDIAIYKNPIPDIEKQLEKHDWVFQINQLRGNGDVQLNSGFFACKPTQATIKHVKGADISKYKDEQDYLNATKGKMDIAHLPIKEYPTGKYWFKDKKNLAKSAKIVHYNFLKGDNKKKRMKDDGNWLIDPSL